jgi:hypothetical protein
MARFSLKIKFLRSHLDLNLNRSRSSLIKINQKGEWLWLIKIKIKIITKVQEPLPEVLLLCPMKRCKRLPVRVGMPVQRKQVMQACLREVIRVGKPELSSLGMKVM